MGKSLVAKYMRQLGIPVFDADAEVHNLYNNNKELIKAVGKQFPLALKDEAIDRGELSKAIFSKPNELKKLEKIVHPLVKAQEKKFIKQAKAKGHKAVVLEIPLLFETEADKRCDKIIIVTAPKFIQTFRALKRSGMSLEKLRQIRKKQLPEKEKLKKADFIIYSNQHKGNTLRQVESIMKQLLV